MISTKGGPLAPIAGVVDNVNRRTSGYQMVAVKWGGRREDGGARAPGNYVHDGGFGFGRAVQVEAFQRVGGCCRNRL
jgi:hypothetical protein